MSYGSGNRAVSSLFRIFGEDEKANRADAYVRSARNGMHLVEFRVLSCLIPFTVFVAVGNGLVQWLDPFAGWVLALPITFVSLSILPLILNAKNQRTQWQTWMALCSFWAIFHCHGRGIEAVVSFVWIGIAVLSLVANALLLLQFTMRWRGICGIVWRATLLVALHVAAICVGAMWGWPFGIAIGLAIAGGICLAVLDPGCQWLGPIKRFASCDEILITIDDGPDPQDSPRLLDLLDKHQVKAIFYLIASKVQEHPELAREIVRRGHEIGNHTQTHPEKTFWCAGPWRSWKEIQKAQETIRSNTGFSPRWFRAPAGHRNIFTHPIAAVLGLHVMGWSRRGYDAVDTDYQRVLSRILPFMARGDIILIHESTPIAVEVLSGVLAVRSRILKSDR